MTDTTPVRSQPCHNCRRRRLRCDRSLPTCVKCLAKGEQCLGYGALLRWTHSVASRGKLAGCTTFEAAPAHSNGQLVVVQSGTDTSAGVAYSLLDPLLQELGAQGQFYTHHFATAVCSDLVSFDQPGQNPFRFVIPLLGQYPFLREIVLATSAIHLATQRRSKGQPTEVELVHALSARQRAIRLLRAALDHITHDNRSVILAAVVFFVNFDLVESGRGTWKAHLDAAGVLINALYGRSHATASSGNMSALGQTMTRLLDGVVADCLTYHILGSTLSAVHGPAASFYDNLDISAVLRRAEAYSYHCCPPNILETLVCATRLASSVDQSTSARADGATQNHTGLAASLLQRALEFDVRGWVASIPNLSLKDDREARVRLASAHRASACLFIILVLQPETPHYADERLSAKRLVEEILHQLSFVPSDHVLSKGSIWPSFMAGAQSDDPYERHCCISRLRATSPWICPWGYVETALATLKSIWAVRDALPLAEMESWNWLKQLRESGNFDCLIV